MKNEKTVEVLNKLITINNDRIEGYELATKETNESELQSLFRRFITTSQKCKAELVRAVIMLGGTEDEGTKISGKFFRVWMEVKSALTSNDRKTILSSCEYGEDAAKNTYDEVLTENFSDLSASNQVMVNEQKQFLQSDRQELKVLSEALANT